MNLNELCSRGEKSTQRPIAAAWAFPPYKALVTDAHRIGMQWSDNKKNQSLAASAWKAARKSLSSASQTLRPHRTCSRCASSISRPTKRGDAVSTVTDKFCGGHV